MKTAEAHLLTPHQFDHYWASIVPQLDTVKHTWDLWWTKDALYQAVMDGWMNCWVIGSIDTIHLVCFTQIINYPANRMLKVVLLFGTGLDTYFDVAEATLEKFAMNNQCVYLEAYGREGWRRRLEGVKCHGVVLTREVSNLKVQ